MKLCIQRQRKTPGVVEGYAKTFQRQIALNPEHRNLLISMEVEDLASDTKNQTGDNAVGRMDQPLDSI